MDDESEFTTETFLVLCRKCDLTRSDLEDMTIGMCLDHINEHVELMRPDEDKPKLRKANQSDFDNF